MINIELKAELPDRTAAEEVCGALSAKFQGIIRQQDTYFPVKEGWLKLRLCEPVDDYLVYYQRPNVAGSKRSDYVITPAEANMRPALLASLGLLAVVEKERTLYLWENVRIHLDRVVGLGDFVEFEAVLKNEAQQADGHAKVAYLQTQFGIAPTSLCEMSYLDMVLAKE